MRRLMMRAWNGALPRHPNVVSCGDSGGSLPQTIPPVPRPPPDTPPRAPPLFSSYWTTSPRGGTPPSWLLPMVPGWATCSSRPRGRPSSRSASTEQPTSHASHALQCAMLGLGGTRRGGGGKGRGGSSTNPHLRLPPPTPEAHTPNLSSPNLLHARTPVATTTTSLAWYAFTHPLPPPPPPQVRYDGRCARPALLRRHRPRRLHHSHPRRPAAGDTRAPHLSSPLTRDILPAPQRYWRSARAALKLTPHSSIASHRQPPILVSHTLSLHHPLCLLFPRQTTDAFRLALEAAYNASSLGLAPASKCGNDWRRR